MIIYDFKCDEGHRFEAVVDSMTSPNPDCKACGSGSRRVPSRVKIGNSASAGTSRDEMPRSWTGISGGHPEAVSHWRKKMESREKLEEKYPELGGDRRPILAHEGIFNGRPLRAGDDIGAAVKDAAQAATSVTGSAHSHAHPATKTKVH
ncbi:zinc ribbon domain-containing protein [Brevibacterium sp. ZH18]|uniref:FmdB family zinc ribbon protein n=1 Tax=Brevibacterium sp. ZH18 TaxID=2927784 RepID=UPI001F5FF5DD|nr:zinc ribbon domain-containing protein [Brevibacterium sp. ZH18]MCI4012229.1 zinc ribbon domain-containing protein [Brevibacterium sp. ZH18]